MIKITFLGNTQGLKEFDKKRPPQAYVCMHTAKHLF